MHFSILPLTKACPFYSIYCSKLVEIGEYLIIFFLRILKCGFIIILYIIYLTISHIYLYNWPYIPLPPSFKLSRRIEKLGIYLIFYQGILKHNSRYFNNTQILTKFTNNIIFLYKLRDKTQKGMGVCQIEWGKN